MPPWDVVSKYLKIGAGFSDFYFDLIVQVFGKMDAFSCLEEKLEQLYYFYLSLIY